MMFEQGVTPAVAGVFGGEERLATTKATGADFTQNDSLQIDLDQVTNS